MIHDVELVPARRGKRPFAATADEWELFRRGWDETRFDREATACLADQIRDTYRAETVIGPDSVLNRLDGFHHWLRTEGKGGFSVRRPGAAPARRKVVTG